jgi:putative aldouronate transport system permease protein
MGILPQTMAHEVAIPRQRRRTWRRIWADRWMYLLVLPGLLYFLIFRYLPLFGNIIAFQDYSPFLGFRDSPWVGLENFRALFSDPDMGLALANTLRISLLQLLLYFPAPIALALLLNSVLYTPLQRLMQSLLYLPHFLSWVIVIALWQQVFGGDGWLNQTLRANALPPVNVMSNPDSFHLLVVLQVIWKETGWGTIIFLAALTRIDPALYEAAAIDGANSWQRLWNITLPGILGVVLLVLILRLGYILNTGFEQIFLQRNAVGPEVAEVLDTLVYFRGIQSGDWGFSAAVGLVKGLVGLVLVLGTNALVKRYGEEGVF